MRLEIYANKKQIGRTFDYIEAGVSDFSIKHVVGIHLSCLGEAIQMNNNKLYFIEKKRKRKHQIITK